MKYFLFIVLIFSYLNASNIDSKEEKITKNYKKIIASVDDMNDTDAQHTISKKIEGLFGLKPHDKNYILPLSYREGTYTSYVPSDEYQNTEAEMQISLKYDASVNLFGFDEIYSLAYTQKSMWQIYTDSSPFRETNYSPEALVSIPIYHNSDILSLKMIRFSLSHQSNGQADVTDLRAPLKTTQINKKAKFR